MTEVPVPISKIFTSVDDVENQCNFIELVLPGKLKKLTAIGEAAAHKNEGIYDRMTSDEFLEHKDELGKLKFKADNGGTNTVWINGIKIKVSFTREG
jgi:hypothetical protein